MRGWVLAVAVSAVFVSARTCAETIDFQHAVAQAWRANPRSLAAAAREQAARGQVRAARGSGLPSLRLQFQAARSDDPVQAYSYRLAQRDLSFADFGLGSFAGPQSLNVAPPELNRPGYVSNFNSAAIVTVPLFAGGGNLARLHAAQARQRAAGAGAAATKARLTYEVLRAYDGVATRDELLRAARAARQAAEEDLQAAQDLFRRGVVIRSDVLTAQANLERARADEQAAAADRDDARDAFRTVIGAPEDHSLEPGAAVDVPLPDLAPSTLQRLALQATPRLQVLKAQAQAALEKVRQARAVDWPRVDLVARHDWNASSPALRAPSNTVMGVVTWDVFASGAHRGAVAAATAQWRAAQADLDDAENALKLEVMQRYRQAQSAALSARAAQAAAQQAAEASRLLALRYQQGLTPINQLLDAQARRDQARAQAAVTLYQAVLARAAVLLAIDRLDPQQAVPLAAAPEVALAAGG
ncbi:MAG: TolC family protein [Gammaproteobacteria bacterium]|nr:TolC family protein [Gammaproteobacteria bacterium]